MPFLHIICVLTFMVTIAVLHMSVYKWVLRMWSILSIVMSRMTDLSNHIENNGQAQRFLQYISDFSDTL